MNSSSDLQTQAFDSSSANQANSVIRASRLAHARLGRRRKKLAAKIEKVTTRLKNHQNARLLAGALFFASLVILALRPGLQLEAPVLLVFLIFFVWLVIATRRIAHFLERLIRLEAFFSRQEKRSQGGTPSGREWKQVIEIADEMATVTPLPRDLGLFGAQSLWALLDETLTDGGLKRLLSYFSEEPKAKDEIERRQNQIKALRPEAWFYTRLTLEASGRNEVRLASSQIVEFLKSPFVEGQFKTLYFVNLFTWLVLAGVTIASMVLSWGIGGYAVLVFAVINFVNLQKTSSAFTKGIGLSHHLGELEPLFAAIEKRLKTQTALQPLLPQTYGAGPSRQVRKLNRILGFLGTQTNPLLHLILNAFTPWTMTAAFALEMRRQKIHASFPVCMAELAEFEAIGSLLIFDLYQTQNYPQILETNSSASLRFEGLFHPLLDRVKVVPNSFSFPHGKSLGLLTGSNMSGKSTFLRTVGVNQLLANMGAPIFGESMQTIPLKIETCIEVSDSLRDGFSYFYAEVRRLKTILAAANLEQPVLFLIDEIFRGTNNRERQIGSRAVIRSLAKSKNSTGFVSTHDLELVSLEDSSPKVLNLHFREDIDAAGKMIFSYHLRPGPCPTTNALKIMQAEGIDLTGAELA